MEENGATEFVPKKEVLEFCDKLIDKITTAKGFLDLNDERDNYFTKATRREIQIMENIIKEYIKKLMSK